MNRMLQIVIVMLVIMLVGAACGSAEISTPTPSPIPPTSTPAPTEVPAALVATGEALFNMYYDEAGFACSTCHHTDSRERLVGPGMKGAAEWAADRIDGMSAPEYIRDSIVNPGDDIAEGYPAGLMPLIYAELFTPEEIDALVAYILTR